jgi:hypothetical protein
MRIAKIASVVLLLRLVAMVSLQAQQIFTAPVPAQIVAAKKVFIANGGRDSLAPPVPYTGEQSRAFEQFYKVVQKSGLFELVATPQEADLVLQISTKVTVSGQERLRLTIYEAESHYVLWKMDSWIEPGVRQATRDRNFDVAVNRLESDLEKLAAPQH